MSQGNGRGPPDHSNAPEHVTEHDDGSIKVGKRPDEQRREEIDRLAESVDWSNAPDWARLLYMEIKELRDDER